ncbi:hypothetical protein CEXT_689111 [Caerostris extrusa]|uniref:Uncharacterized protein n=1 Tax=Caerostris extrusa TaxID=172846 RepID=A0AAV4NNK3_CAEEX|nr:hypothetical protein CEXT_689111 [Caerostris extrusa]
MRKQSTIVKENHYRWRTNSSLAKPPYPSHPYHSSLSNHPYSLILSPYPNHPYPLILSQSSHYPGHPYPLILIQAILIQAILIRSSLAKAHLIKPSLSKPSLSTLILSQSSHYPSRPYPFILKLIYKMRENNEQPFRTKDRNSFLSCVLSICYRVWT